MEDLLRVQLDQQPLDSDEVDGMTAAFFCAFAHQALFKLGCLPASSFALQTFEGLLFRRCTIPAVEAYIDRVQAAVAHWLSEHLLRSFSIQFLGDGQKVLAEFCFRIDTMLKVEEFDSSDVDFEEVRARFRTILSNFQFEPASPVIPKGKCEELSLRICCTLAGGLQLDRKDWRTVDTGEFGQLNLARPVEEDRRARIDTSPLRMKLYRG